MTLWQDPRWERKCVVQAQFLDHLRIWVDMHQLAFRRSYGDRRVRSLYFDSAMLDDFCQNLAGVSDRKKLRLRWYGDTRDVRQARLEVKHKRNQLGIKHAWDVQLERSLFDIPLGDLTKILTPQVPDEAKVLLQRMHPAVLIDYARSYFESADGRIRITIDRDLQVHSQLDGGSLDDLGISVFPDVIVLELKYAAELDDEVRALVEYLPGRCTRFSKYAVGLQAVLGV